MLAVLSSEQEPGDNYYYNKSTFTGKENYENINNGGAREDTYYTNMPEREEQQFYTAPYNTGTIGYGAVVNGTYRSNNYNGASLNSNLATYNENMYVKVGYNGKDIPTFRNKQRSTINIHENNDYQNPHEHFRKDSSETEKENSENPLPEPHYKGPSALEKAVKSTTPYKDTVYQDPSYQTKQKLPGVMV